MVKSSGAILALLSLFYSTPYVSAAPQEVPSAASFYVPSLPDVHMDPNNPLKIFAGYLSVDPTASTAKPTDITSHLYFVMVKNRRLADKRRIIFWFNGGPGCSSFDGLMMEVGPWRTNFKGGWDAKPGGWEEYATMVYVDQPAGTGFSYTSTDRYVHTLAEASTQILEFFRQFYKVFPEYKTVDTYLAGESFAGQWIPAFAAAILDSNLDIPLRGAAIGNGWMDPRRQYATYLEFAVKVGILEENSDVWKEAKKETDSCLASFDKLKNSEPMEVPGCDRLVLKIVKSKNHKENGKDMCLNIYDVRYMDTAPACGMNWPPDMAPINHYLVRQDVVHALHAIAPSGGWKECRHNIHSAFRERTENSSVTVLPKVLSKIPVLIFAGDQDLICNYVGLEAMIKDLTWNGAKGLGTVETQSWNVNNTAAGTWVSSRNLTYAKIFNASHMAPYDVPHVTHDMMLRFMGFNFSAVVGGSAGMPSSLGSVKKPTFVQQIDNKPSTAPVPGKTPEQDKAMWEAYYNAGSAALVLLLIFAVIGTFVWCRVRRRRLQLPLNNNSRELEESIPLNTSHHGNSLGAHENGDDHDDDSSYRQSKGKGRAVEPEETVPEPPIFDVGDSDEEDGEDRVKTPGRK